MAGLRLPTTSSANVTLPAVTVRVVASLPAAEPRPSLGEVVGITLEMQRLAANLTRQVAQFKIRKGSSATDGILDLVDEVETANPGD